MTDTTTKLFDRIRALIAKSESTEHQAEAEAFQRKAGELMAKHRLSRGDLGEAEQDIETRVIRVSQLWGSKPYGLYRSSLLMMVANSNGVDVLMNRAYGSRNPKSIQLTGLPDSIDATLMLFDLLDHQADRAVLAYIPPVWADAATQREDRKSIIMGFAYGIGERLKEGVEQAEDESPGIGLVLVSDLEKAKEANGNVNGVYSKATVSRTGYAAGARAAANADIGRQRVDHRAPKQLH